MAMHIAPDSGEEIEVGQSMSAAGKFANKSRDIQISCKNNDHLFPSLFVLIFSSSISHKWVNHVSKKTYWIKESFLMV